MFLLQFGAPTGVIRNDIQKKTAALRMDGVAQFAKLVHTGGALIEFDKGRINCREILQGVGTAEAAKFRIRGRRWGDWQKVQDAAAQRVNYMRKLLNEIA